MPWLSNAIIGGSACPDVSPMKRSPTTIGTPVTWQSDYLTGVESVAYAYQVGARSIAAVRYPAAQAAPRGSVLMVSKIRVQQLEFAGSTNSLRSMRKPASVPIS